MGVCFWLSGLKLRGLRCLASGARYKFRGLEVEAEKLRVEDVASGVPESPHTHPCIRPCVFRFCEDGQG